MTKAIASKLCLSSVLLLTCGCIFKQQKPDVLLELEAVSQYNHRGMVQNDRGALQPRTRATLEVVDFGTVDGGSLFFDWWGSLNWSDETGHAWLPDGFAGRFTNIEITGGYARAFDLGDAVDLGLTAGAVAYIMTSGQGQIIPNVRDERTSTSEVFASADLDLFQDRVWGFTPHATVHYDPDEADGVYLNGGIRSKQYSIWRDLSAIVDLTVGYSDDAHSLWTYGVSDAGFADFTGKATLLYDLNENTFAFAGVAGSVIIDSEIADWFDLIGIDSENVWARGGIGYRF